MICWLTRASSQSGWRSVWQKSGAFRAKLWFSFTSYQNVWRSFNTSEKDLPLKLGLPNSKFAGALERRLKWYMFCVDSLFLLKVISVSSCDSSTWTYYSGKRSIVTICMQRKTLVLRFVILCTCSDLIYIHIAQISWSVCGSLRSPTSTVPLLQLEKHSILDSFIKFFISF